MDYDSTWQRHKARACQATCIYCEQSRQQMKFHFRLFHARNFSGVNRQDRRREERRRTALSKLAGA